MNAANKPRIVLADDHPALLAEAALIKVVVLSVWEDPDFARANRRRKQKPLRFNEAPGSAGVQPCVALLRCAEQRRQDLCIKG